MKRTAKSQEKQEWEKPAIVVVDGEYIITEDSARESVEEENCDGDEAMLLPTLLNSEESPYNIIVEKAGYDPYDSGSFETSKSRSRK